MSYVLKVSRRNSCSETMYYAGKMFRDDNGDKIPATDIYENAKHYRTYAAARIACHKVNNESDLCMFVIAEARTKKENALLTVSAAV